MEFTNMKRQIETGLVQKNEDRIRRERYQEGIEEKKELGRIQTRRK